MSNSTAASLVTLAYNILGEDGTTVAHPALQQTTMLKVLDDANREWQRAFRVAGEPPQPIRKQTAFALIADTTLSAAQASGATTASLTDSSSFGSSGAIAVWDDATADVQEFTGNAANALSGVTGCDWAHESGDTVQLLYALPSNFGSFRATEDYPDGVRLDSGMPFTFTSGEPQGFRFTTYDNGTTKYLWLPRGVSGSVVVTYNKKNTTLDEGTDEVDWEVAYDFFGVYRLVEHGLRARGNNPDKVQEARMVADEKIRDAMKDRNVGKMFKIRPMGRGRNPELSLYRTNFR